MSPAACGPRVSFPLPHSRLSRMSLASHRIAPAGAPLPPPPHQLHGRWRQGDVSRRDAARRAGAGLMRLSLFPSRALFAHLRICAFYFCYSSASRFEFSVRCVVPRFCGVVLAGVSLTPVPATHACPLCVVRVSPQPYHLVGTPAGSAGVPRGAVLHSNAMARLFLPAPPPCAARIESSRKSLRVRLLYCVFYPRISRSSTTRTADIRSSSTATSTNGLWTPRVTSSPTRGCG